MKITKFNTQIFDITKQTKNNTIYSKECIQKMTGTFPVVSDIQDYKTENGSYPLTKIIGECASTYNEKEDVLDIEGTFLKEVPEDCYIVPCGLGRVDTVGNVSNYKLYCFAVSNSSSFKESKISIKCDVINEN